MSTEVASVDVEPLPMPVQTTMRDTRNSTDSPTAAVASATKSTTTTIPSNELSEACSTLNIPGSEQFDKVMHDIQTRRQEQLRKLQEQLRAERQGEDVQINLQDLKELINEEEEEEDEEEDQKKEAKQEIVLTPVQMAAHRAWATIRRYVQEKAMKNRNQKSKMNWSVLKQTLSHMSNMERAREDLYERYLYHPESWTDGLTQIPANIFKKGKSGRYTYKSGVSTENTGSVTTRSEAVGKAASSKTPRNVANAQKSSPRHHKKGKDIGSG